jgi:hypothetical protein
MSFIVAKGSFDFERHAVGFFLCRSDQIFGFLDRQGLRFLPGLQEFGIEGQTYLLCIVSHSTNCPFHTFNDNRFSGRARFHFSIAHLARIGAYARKVKGAPNTAPFFSIRKFLNAAKVLQ